jgi:aspartyl aminopeptidase
MDRAHKAYLNGLMGFLHHSSTAWHATKTLKKLFRQYGFVEIHESDAWHLQPGGRYIICRGGSTFAACVLPTDEPRYATILGSHSDSPALKIKPQAQFRRGNMVMLGTEIYGSPLLSSWLNRDLGIAGKIYYIKNDGSEGHSLVDIRHTPLVIPQLAIHLDRGVNEQGLLLNKQEHMAAMATTASADSDGNYLLELLQRHISFHTLLSHDLMLYPLEPPAYLGLHKEMIAGYRLDNLCSAYASALALIHECQPSPHGIKLMACWDNEEIGSETAGGAASPFLPHTLERMLLSCGYTREAYLRILSQSTCVSIDLAHAAHPNYMEKHDPQHRPLLNQGVVLKINAQQRYATTAQTAAKLMSLAHHSHIPIQPFVTRSDMPCGSTIGPITAALTGIPTVDIGIPQLSMHSARELVGTTDCIYLLRLLQECLRNA